MPKTTRFTIYDVLDSKGVFESNPANAGSRNHEGLALYAGPVEFPKMMYHPEGKERVVVPAELLMTPIGPKEVGEQRELISQVVNSPAEEKTLADQGWHRHPAAAMAAAGKAAPATGADHQIAELERKLAAMQAERDELVARQPAPPKTPAKAA